MHILILKQTFLFDNSGTFTPPGFIGAFRSQMCSLFGQPLVCKPRYPITMTAPIQKKGHWTYGSSTAGKVL